MSEDGLTGNVYEIKVLPNTASQLVEAIYKQKDLSRAEAREMAQYLDDRYNMSDYVPLTPSINNKKKDFRLNNETY